MRHFPFGLSGYVAGGKNKLSVTPDTQICMSSVKLSLYYAPMLPNVTHIVPRAGRMSGGTEIKFYSKQLPEHTDGLVCVFGKTMVPVHLSKDACKALFFLAFPRLTHCLTVICKAPTAHLAGVNTTLHAKVCCFFVFFLFFASHSFV